MINIIAEWLIVKNYISTTACPFFLMVLSARVLIFTLLLPTLTLTRLGFILVSVDCIDLLRFLTIL